MFINFPFYGKKYILDNDVDLRLKIDTKIHENVLSYLLGVHCGQAYSFLGLCPNESERKRILDIYKGGLSIKNFNVIENSFVATKRHHNNKPRYFGPADSKSYVILSMSAGVGMEVENITITKKDANQSYIHFKLSLPYDPKPNLIIRPNVIQCESISLTEVENFKLQSPVVLKDEFLDLEI